MLMAMPLLLHFYDVASILKESLENAFKYYKLLSY